MSYAIKGAPFRYNGAINVEDCETSADVMKKAGLDWEVAKCELVAKMPFIEGLLPEDNDSFEHEGELFKSCPNAYATYRTDYNIPLGVVKDRYTPVQNIEAFTFFDDAIGKDKAIWQTAGYFGNGERVFVSAKLPNNILVNGDPVENYLVFTTSHDGSSGVKILFTPIRVICQNTLNAAIAGADNYVSFRHTSSVHRNIDCAKEILGICKQNSVYLQEKYTEMSKISIKDTDAAKYFAQVILNSSEYAELTNSGYNPMDLVRKNWNAMEASGVSTKKVNVIADMYKYYHTGPGQQEQIGNGWGLYNAVTGYYSNLDNSIGIKRMDSLLYGDKSRKLSFAANTLLGVK